MTAGSDCALLCDNSPGLDLKIISIAQEHSQLTLSVMSGSSWDLTQSLVGGSG